MKKLCLFLTLILMFGCVAPVYAYDTNDEMSVRDQYTQKTVEFFSVENGTASVVARYYGYSGITTGATIEITLQKRFLLFWWNDVEGGHWTDNFTTSSGTSNHSLAVPSGTYRAVINYKIYGSDGGYDEISKTVTE